MRTDDWDADDPGLIHHLTTDAEWTSAIDRYLASNNDLPLQRCVQVARLHGAVTLVVETRYLDLDYRSELQAFYAGTFATIPDSAHRLHFFRSRLDPDDLWNLPAEHGYIGYIAIRPAATGPVSRAMLPPPPDMASSIRTSATERVNFFGQYLTITGVPFAQQDAQLGTCAHAAAWVCHYSAHLRGDVARRPRADFSLLADRSLLAERHIPTSGLTVNQLSELFRTMELPSMFYRVGSLPSPSLPWQPAPPSPTDPNADPGTWDHRIVAVVCRYLNSGFPVLVGTQDHAFVLCGYDRTPSSSEPKWITFVRHDDQLGPYLPVGNVLDDKFTIRSSGTIRDYGPWRTMHVPVPAKIWLTPEPAEREGGQLLVEASKRVAPQLTNLGVTGVEPFEDLIQGDRLALHTYACRSNDFKLGLQQRGIDATITREYRLARFSRWLWVVEAIDRARRQRQEPCVLGEAIFDSTSADTRPNLLALRAHGVAWVHRTDGSVRFPIVGSPDPYQSASIGPL